MASVAARRRWRAAARSMTGAIGAGSSSSTFTCERGSGISYEYEGCRRIEARMLCIEVIDVCHRRFMLRIRVSVL